MRVHKKGNNMKAETTNIKSKRGGPGRPVGYRTPSTLKKLALKTLEQIMFDTSAPAEARAMAACKLIDQAQP